MSIEVQRLDSSLDSSCAGYCESDSDNFNDSDRDSEYFASTPVGSNSDYLVGDNGYGEIQNNTEAAITTFERFISNEWPDDLQDLALEVLRYQFMYGGGFCSVMKTVDLSTPKNVRLDIEKVLLLLKEKTSISHITSLQKFVLPVVKTLRSGDVVKKLLGDFCGALSGGLTTLPKVDEIVIHCDELSNDFHPGDLEWIGEFHSAFKPISQDKLCTDVKVST